MVMKLFKLTIPKGKKEIDAVETFEVRWESVRVNINSILTERRKEGQFFASAEDANAFKESLERATKLLRDSNRHIS